LVLRLRLFDTARTRRAVLQQLLESLQTLASCCFLGFSRSDSPLRFDALIAIRRDERRDGHQPLTTMDTDARPRSRSAGERASDRCRDDHTSTLWHDNLRSERSGGSR
jgi:hypothetical protein